MQNVPASSDFFVLIDTVHRIGKLVATMPSETATAIAYVGAFVGLIGGGVALFNSWKHVCWKRAELANNYLKDFNNNPELVFAGRCLDWNGGKLILPESLRAYMPDGVNVIEHDQKPIRDNLSVNPKFPLF